MALSVAKGEVFALDMLDPESKGYKLSGAFFDPSMFRMERFVTYDDEGKARARYLFTALNTGISDVLVKMAPAGGGEAAVYKQVGVTIGE